MKNKNPYNICTWNDKENCKNCNIGGKLACRWDIKLLKGFHGISWPPVLISIIGMSVVGFLTGEWWLLYSYVIYFFIMLGILETCFLCSHCPYYAEEGKILHCLANHGSFKFWSYHPEPLNKFEKFMMYFLIVSVFFVFPLSALGYGIGYVAVNFSEYGLISLLGLMGLTLANLISAGSFAVTLKTFYCPQCVNFSCPLNEVPKSVIDAYLKKNLVMREAWERSGWRIEN